MNLIIGGNSQGKLDFALTLLDKNQQIIKDTATLKNNDRTLIDTAFAEKTVADGEVIDFKDVFSRPILNKLHVDRKSVV